MFQQRGLLPLLICLALAAARPAGGKAPADGRKKTADTQQPAHADAQGDPLPEGATVRFGTTRFREGGYLSGAALSPDGKVLADSSRRAAARLLSVRTGRELRQFTTNAGSMTNLAFSPNGSMLAGVGGSREVILWELATGKQIRRLGPAQGLLPAFAFSADSKVMAVGDMGFAQKHYIYAWEVKTGKDLGHLEPVHNHNLRVALSPDGKRLASCGQYVAGGVNDPPQDMNRVIQLWDLRTGKERRRVKMDSGFGAAAVFSPDGKILITADGGTALTAWSLATGKQLRRFAARRGTGAFLAFSPDGKTLAAGTDDGTIQLWDNRTGKHRGLCKPPDRCRFSSLAFASDGTAVACGIEGQAVVLWEVPSGKLLTPPAGHHSGVAAVAFARDGKSVVSVANAGEACVWAADTGSQMRRINLKEEERMRYGLSRFSACAISPDGKHLLAGGPFRALGLWELSTGQKVYEFDSRTQWQGLHERLPGLAAAFSPDGSLLATVDTDQRTGTTSVRLWDVGTGRELRKLKGLEGEQRGLAFSPDGKTLAVGSYMRGRGPYEVRVCDVATGKELGAVKTPVNWLQALTFSPDDKTLALVEPGGAVRFWEPSRSKEIRGAGGEAGYVTAPPVFSPDGRTLAVAGLQIDKRMPFSGNRKNQVRLWEVASGTVRQEFSGHEGTISAVTFAPDGRTLATGSSDTTVLLWDLTGGPRPARAARLSAKDLDALWTELAETDGRAGFRAICRLVAAPREAVPFLKQHLRKIGPDTQAIGKLIAQLDDNKFTMRAQATRELEGLGKAAGPALRNFLEGKPSPEARRRAQQVLAKLEAPGDSPQMIRLLRALEVLERIGTRDARQVLQTLAAGNPDAQLTRAAKASLHRLLGQAAVR